MCPRICSNDCPLRMMTMIVMAACLALAFDATAQDASLPSGKEVLERYVEVTGGRDAYEKVRTRVSETTLEIPAAGITGKMTIYQMAPDKGYIVTDIPGIGKVEQGTDGKVAWERSPMTGARLLEGQEQDNLIRSLTLNSELHPEKYYEKMETVGVEDVNGKPAYKVELTSKAGGKETRFYDRESGLMVQTTMTQESPQGVITVIGRPEEYEEMEGITMPRKVTQEAMGQRFTLTIDKVQHNTEIAEDKFHLPEDVKALVAEQSQEAPTTQP